MKRTLLLLLFLFVSSISALADSEEKAVLLPVAGPLTPEEKAGLAQELSKNFSGKYVLKYGADVDKIVAQVFMEESKKNDCDETVCYKKIAEQFGVEIIISLRLSSDGASSYVAAMSIYNVVEGTIIHSRMEKCANCSYEKLKELLVKLILAKGEE